MQPKEKQRHYTKKKHLKTFPFMANLQQEMEKKKMVPSKRICKAKQGRSNTLYSTFTH